MSSPTTAEPITVVIPCHDDGATLEEAVASVQAQDEPLEIIVVDDGSTDPATIAATARVARRGARMLRQSNQGPAAARMAGLRATGARYVLPLDADDQMTPGALALLRGALERHPEAVAAWGNARHFGAVDFVQRIIPSLDPWQLIYRNPLPLTALYRRDAVLAVGGWQLVDGYEDWDLWMALAEHGWSGVGLDAVVVRCRVGPRGRLSASTPQYAEHVAQLRARHPSLFAQRRRHRRASPAPALLKVALPALDALPLTPTSRRLLTGAAFYVGYGSGPAVLAARMRAHRMRRASVSPTRDRGRHPDERGDEPQVAPVERVDERAVDQQPAPGAQERGRTDAVGVAADAGVAGGEQQRPAEQGDERRQPQAALLGEHPDVHAVGRDRLDELELPRADAERVRLGEAGPAALGGEPPDVVGLGAGPMFQQGAGAGQRDRRGADAGERDDQRHPDRQTAAGVGAQRDHEQHHGQRDGEVQPARARVGEQDAERQNREAHGGGSPAQAQEPGPQRLLDEDRSGGDEERPEDVRVLEQPLGAGGALTEQRLVPGVRHDEREQRQGRSGDGTDDVGTDHDPHPPGGGEVGRQPDREDHEVQRDREEPHGDAEVDRLARGEQVQRDQHDQRHEHRARHAPQVEAAAGDAAGDHHTEQRIRGRGLHAHDAQQEEPQRDHALDRAEAARGTQADGRAVDREGAQRNLLLQGDATAVEGIAPAPLTVETISDPERFAALGDDWDRLVRAMARPSPFLLHGWLDAWWRHYGAGATLAVHVVRRGDRLEGALPLFIRRRHGVRVARVLADDAAGPADLLLHPAAGPDVPLRLADAARRSACDLVDVFGVPGHSRLASAVAPHELVVVRRVEAPVIDLEAGWEAVYRARTSAHGRREHRRALRRLAELGCVEFTVARTAAELRPALEAAFHVHAARWNDRPEPSGFATATGQCFRREAFAALAVLGVPQITLLRVDGRPIACNCLLLLDGTATFHELAFDPEFEHLAPGRLTTLHALAAAAAEGIRRVEFLGGAEQYKLALADRCEPLHEAIGLATTRRGRLTAQARVATVVSRRRLKRTPARALYYDGMASARRAARRLATVDRSARRGTRADSDSRARVR